MNLIKTVSTLTTISFLLLTLTGCGEENKKLTEAIIPVNSTYFIKENLVQ